MQRIPEKLYQRLENRKTDGLLRRLAFPANLVDFCSNDYLGFSRSQELYDQISSELDQMTIKSNGATGSRLISGNNMLVENLESKIAHFFKGESALFFNAGYNANQSILSAVPQKGDTIIYDELVHASARDGLRLSFANKVSFRHNDLEDFQRKIKDVSGDIYVVVESIYSMDGDICPLKELVQICKKYKAYLIVDEAHSVGIIGGKGQGLSVEEGVQDDIFARVYTFGKALGVHGACVVGSQSLINYLINFSRPFIYTTALPAHSIISVSCALDYLTKADKSRQKLDNNIAYFQHNIRKVHRELLAHNIEVIESHTVIQGVIIPDNIAAKSKAAQLQQHGFDVRPILAPTVKVGSERLRICLHSFNTYEEIDLLIKKIAET